MTSVHQASCRARFALLNNFGEHNNGCIIVLKIEAKTCDVRAPDIMRKAWFAKHHLSTIRAGLRQKRAFARRFGAGLALPVTAPPLYSILEYFPELILRGGYSVVQNRKRHGR